MMNINKHDIDQLTTAAANRWGSWAKYLIGALIGALAAAGVLTVTGCTVSPAQAQDMHALDAFLHEYGALIITVEDGK